jgi:Tol biopolymer transport system component
MLSARRFPVLFLFAVLCASAACQASATATPTAAPVPLETSTPIPTATIPPTETPIPTEPPPTETPLPTATPLPPVATTRIIVNVRAGPGAGFALIGKLARGVSKEILGKSEDSKWWQIEYEGKRGWIAADFTDVRGGTSGVRVIAVARPPTPTELPTGVVITRLQPTVTPTADIPLSNGRIYFVVKQPDGSYTTAWVRPTKKQEIFSDVTLGTAPGDLSGALSTNASPLDWSDRAGKLAYVVGSGTQNKLQTIDQNQNVVDVASHGAIVTPRWFADGGALAYIGYDNNLQNQKIYMVNADGSQRRECFGARSGETLRGLDVSPVTREIIFVSNYTGGSELWRLDGNCAPGAETLRLTEFNLDTTAPAFSPDGTQLAFVSNQAAASQFDIYLMDYAPGDDGAGAGMRRLIAGFSPIFSPDGNWLAFSQNGEVYIMDITGNRIQTVAPGYAPAWANE